MSSAWFTKWCIIHMMIVSIVCMEVKLGVILPEDTLYPWSVKRVLPAIEVAVEVVEQRKILPFHRISIQTADSKCSETFGPLAAVDLYSHNSAHVFLGPVCDYALAPVARFSPYWGIPVMSGGGFALSYDDKLEYSLLTRAQGSYSKAALGLLTMAQTYNWTRFGIIYHDNVDGNVAMEKSDCYFRMQAVFFQLSLAPERKLWHQSFDENQPQKYNFKDILKQASNNADVIILCASVDSVRKIMITAHDLNLDKGEYTFLALDVFSSTIENPIPWYRDEDTNERNNKARKAYEALMLVTDRRPTSSEYMYFSSMVRKRAAKQFPNVTFKENEFNSYTGTFHDAVILYALALNETLEANKSITDGAEVTRRMWNRTITGITGDFSIDENGDRNTDLSLLDMNPETGEFQVVANYYGNTKRFEPLPGKSIHWPWSGEKSGAPPQPPQNLTITACHSRSVELSWKPGNNNGSDITGYLVQYNIPDEPMRWNNSTEIGGDVDRFRLDLPPWGDYKFRILAKNAFGSSKPSLPTKQRCATPPDRPLEHPQHVRTETHKKGKLIIRWTPLSRSLQGGPGARYIINWRREGRTNWYKTIQEDVEASMFETSVNDVFNLYEISVESANWIGGAPGQALTILGRSGEAEPKVVPRDFMLDPEKPVELHAAHFVWKPVDTSDEMIQGEFQGYMLSCTGQTGKKVDITIAKDDIDEKDEYIRGTVYNLTAGTTFQAQVSVKNTHYVGPPNQITFRTPEKASKFSQKNVSGTLQITNITASNETIHLTWIIPNELHSSLVSKYRIDCQHLATDEQSKKRWEKLKHFTTKKRQATIRGLKPGTLYRLRVTVKTPNGQKRGPKSKWYQTNTTDVGGTAFVNTREIRLPKSVRPVHYNLTFQPQIYGKEESKFTYEGTTEVTLVCVQKTKKILLHSKNLTWINVTLRNKRQKALDVVQLNNYTDVEMVEIKIGKELKVNQSYTLYIKYTGKITDILQGFYYSPYKEDNETKYIFTTMMEPTDARRVFPCFDEPDFKATFQINLVRKTPLRTTSNAVLERTEVLDEDHLIDRYAVSPKMSTYLVAFAIGDMDYLETRSGTTLFRTWSRRSSVHLTKFALDIGAQLLKFFENYFQIKYPLEKEDMVAVPTLIFNAMEHWGMVTYREAGMLYEEGVSSEADKEWTALLISHELSHQWFGNLVSPRWWDDLWLNEGFATYMMFLGTNAILPKWNMMNKLPVNYRGMQNVMSVDDGMTSHPVYVPVSHPDEINEIFDLISYAKGCATIRMMNFFLGDGIFIRGLKRYLTEYSYSTATHNDLWRVLGQQAADEGNDIIDVKSVMDTWLLEMNYPVVTVKRTTPTTFSLTQTAFLLNDWERQNRSNVFWEIPFVYTHEKEQNFDKTPEGIIWLHKDGVEVRAEDKSLANSTWIIGNVQQVGFYRVQYENENWYAILEQLKTDHLEIHPINRAQIINDAWNLAKANMLDFHIALQTLDYLDQEVDFVPWKAAFRELDYLCRSLHLTPAYGNFKALMRKKLDNAYSKNIGSDSHYEEMQLSVVATQACKYGMEACVEAALKEFDKWISNSSYRVDPDLKTSIYCTGVRVKGSTAWDEVLQRFKETSSASERGYLLEALSCIEEPWIMKMLLQLTISSDVFSNTEKVDAVDHLANTPIGRLLAWDFVVDNWDFYFEKYGSGLNLFAKLVSGVTKTFNTKEELNRVEYFVKQHDDLGTATREFKKILGKLKFNIAWMEKHFEDIHKWLAAQAK